VNPFEDPRLAGLYDRDNPDGPDRDFYRRLADDIDARRIVDLGCGTGLLTCSLATSGRTVIGIDPAAAMLDIARRRAGNVSWIHGDAGDLPGNDADLALMTANVAQVFTTDPEWARTLDGLRRALRAGGTLAFESRNPDARAWETWGALRRVETLHGPLTRWAEKIHERDGLVTYDAHYRFEATGEHLVSPGALRFRSAAAIGADLSKHGFVVRHLYGDWERGPVRSSSAVMVFVATAI
jgi:SAM-dependent methyltransferase